MNNKKPLQGKILPQDPNQCIQRLTKISQALMDLAERESQALVINDMMSFSILQDEKDMLASQYMKASEEFRERVQEFRRVDRSLLDRLEKLQTKLGEKTHSNNALVSQMRKRAQTKTQKTLLTVQEMGQVRPVKLAHNNSQQERISS